MDDDRRCKENATAKKTEGRLFFVRLLLLVLAIRWSYL